MMSTKFASDQELGPTSADFVAADLLAKMVLISDPVVIELAAWCLAAAREAHTCIDLTRFSHEQLRSLDDPESVNVNSVELVEVLDQHLQNSVGVRVIREGEVLRIDSSVADVRPLVLVGTFLYTQRQFVDELSVAQQFNSRASVSVGRVSSQVEALANQVKPRTEDADGNIENDVLQAVGANRFIILTGGPGTGKTSMTISAIAMMMTLAEEPLDHFDIALCAPTGKAAARLKEAIQDFLSDERRSAWIDDAVRLVLKKVEPTTIHRLLGRRRGESTRFRHNAETQLRHPIVAVDEASMISAQLMARLFEAVAADAQLLLVGDPGQLESVEAGSVLGQLMLGQSKSEASSDGRVGSIFTLRKIWRTGAGSAIPKLASSVREGDDSETIYQLSARNNGIEWLEVDDPSRHKESVAGDVVIELRAVQELARKSGDSAAHREALDRAGAVKILCGPREGIRGVSFWNEWISTELGISLNDRSAPGRLVLVEQNSPRTGLSNGDIGLIVETPNGPQAVFPGTPELRYFSMAALPPVQTCFAMTIHKSQGSEYKDLVVVILPALASPLLNRQLIYTAITRTKNRVRLVGSQEAVRQAVIHQSGRASGLAELISRIGG